MSVLGGKRDGGARLGSIATGAVVAPGGGRAARPDERELEASVAVEIRAVHDDSAPEIDEVGHLRPRRVDPEEKEHEDKEDVAVFHHGCFHK